MTMFSVGTLNVLVTAAASLMVTVTWDCAPSNSVTPSGRYWEISTVVVIPSVSPVKSNTSAGMVILVIPFNTEASPLISTEPGSTVTPSICNPFGRESTDAISMATDLVEVMFTDTSTVDTLSSNFVVSTTLPSES